MMATVVIGMPYLARTTYIKWGSTGWRNGDKHRLGESWHGTSGLHLVILYWTV